MKMRIVLGIILAVVATARAAQQGYVHQAEIAKIVIVPTHRWASELGPEWNQNSGLMTVGRCEPDTYIRHETYTRKCEEVRQLDWCIDHGEFRVVKGK